MEDQLSRREFLRAGAVAGASWCLPDFPRDAAEAATFFRRGRQEFGRGDLQAAISSLTQALELDPRHEESLDLRSMAFETLDDHEGALTDRTAIIRLNPSSQNFLLRGVYALGHDPALAVGDFSEVIRLDPTHADAHLYRAIALEEQEEYEKALADYCIHTRLDPENARWMADDIARITRLMGRRSKQSVPG